MENSTVYQTSFGMFCPCDLQTYKKLKRINHLITQAAQPWAARYERSQKRLPHNRHFTFHRVRHQVQDSWLFPPLFQTAVRDEKEWDNSACKYKVVQKTYVHITELFQTFNADYSSARHPVAEPEDVKTLKLSVDQLDQLLGQLENFVEARKSDLRTAKEPVAWLK